MLLDRHDGSVVSSKVFHSLNNYHIVKAPTKFKTGEIHMSQKQNPKQWTDFSKAKEQNHDLTYEQFINNQKEHEL